MISLNTPALIFNAFTSFLEYTRVSFPFLQAQFYSKMQTSKPCLLYRISTSRCSYQKVSEFVYTIILLELEATSCGKELLVINYVFHE